MQPKNTHRSPARGFTLIEVMVVLVIIGLMGAIIGPTVFGKVQQAEETRIAQDVRAIEGALKMYRLDNYDYPSEGDGLEALLQKPSTARNWRGPYLESVPEDPWGRPYRYAYPGVHGKEVEVFTLGRDGTDGGEGSDADWGSWNIK
ncbi:MAG: type II secretion system major pseudopilin GspG [Cellvibrionales bacterium]|nr:type II secretion system major pseudopilin GspG [Cellvibrionales bacterium]